MSDLQRPKVGVGVIIHDGAGNIVMGERAGSHGAGTMQCPGGHLEYGESFAECAKREVLEETGLVVDDVKFETVTNDVFGEGKHYITIFVSCVIVGDDRTPKVGSCHEMQIISASSTDDSQPMEPEKCARWDWIRWEDMWRWSREQAEAEAAGKKIAKSMFLPLVNLVRERPEMESRF